MYLRPSGVLRLSALRMAILESSVLLPSFITIKDGIESLADGDLGVLNAWLGDLLCLESIFDQG